MNCLLATFSNLVILNYRNYVKNPMDLETIDNKLDEGEYDDPGEFASDMRLMFKNCHKYNNPGDDVVVMADKLRVRNKTSIWIRGVMIPGLESISESGFGHFFEFDDSNSSKNQFLHCTGIDSGYWNRFQNWLFITVMIPIPTPIPEKTES